MDRLNLKAVSREQQGQNKKTIGKERAEHALCSCIQDEVTTFDTFPATVQGLDEGEKPHRKAGTRR